MNQWFLVLGITSGSYQGGVHSIYIPAPYNSHEECDAAGKVATKGGNGWVYTCVPAPSNMKPSE